MFAAFGAGFAWQSTSYPIGNTAHMGPGNFPLWPGIILALLGMVILARSFSQNVQEPRIMVFNWRLLILAVVPIALLLPALLELALQALQFSSVNYFAWILLYLTGVAVLACGSLLKAVAMVVLGLLLGLVGTDVNSGVERFVFGIPALKDGINSQSVLMGALGIGLWAKLPKSRYRTGFLALLLAGVITLYGLWGYDNFFLISTIVFGVAGYLWAKLKCVSAPLYFGMVCSARMEENLRRMLLLSRGSFTPLLTHPLSATFLALALILLVLAVLQKTRRKTDRREPPLSGT
jgi:TctA family transporter